ncbi:adenosylmethionine-8-amino-7-oxononanoate aminotransferase [Thermococcus siculi]|uniref:Adenosylmethionine-8-amino-7-oxononanoate aminotransferase n=1 Tax=Thermococcus siculi TaxID=72803 RepID=A0A2Z2MPW9_9EURY|nr:adenosylmethionine-8-amino-7-oxononanoate aminotransferase [Thermococcus siculi]ASJ09675.1 adenosylmethionine-8-amino-7-oxononanoate aminotransferase [Thermococcus siculi]
MKTAFKFAFILFVLSFSEAAIAYGMIDPLWSLSTQAESIDVSENYVLVVSDTLRLLDRTGDPILERPTPLWAGLVDKNLVILEDANVSELNEGTMLKTVRVTWINPANKSSTSYAIKIKNFPPWIIAKGEKYVVVLDFEPMGNSTFYVLDKHGIARKLRGAIAVEEIKVKNESIYVRSFSNIYKFKEKREWMIDFPICIFPRTFDVYKNFIGVLLNNGTLLMLENTKKLWGKDLEFSEAHKYECFYATYSSPLYAELGFLGDKLLVTIDNEVMLYDTNGTLLWTFELDENVTKLATSNSLALAITPNKVYFISKDGILGSYITPTNIKHAAISNLNAIITDFEAIYFFTFEAFVTVTDVDESIAREVFSNEMPGVQIILGKAAAKFVNATFTRDTMKFNGTVYKSIWRKEDYCLIQPENGRVFIVGTHRYGTKACLLYYKERKPRKPVLLKWRDLDRDSIVEIEELIVLS